MNLATRIATTQPKTTNHSLVDMAARHVKAAALIAQDDLRYLGAMDLQEIRINLHLALELLAANATEGVGGKNER